MCFPKGLLESQDFSRSLYGPELRKSNTKKRKLKSPEVVNLALLGVEDLGCSADDTIDKILARGEELGLELCPPTVGPEFRLQYTDQSPWDDDICIGMKGIFDRYGRGPFFAFCLEWIDDGSCLTALFGDIHSMRPMRSYTRFAFRIPKKRS